MFYKSASRAVSFAAVTLLLVMLSANVFAEDNPLAAMEAVEQQLFEGVAPSVVFISRGSSMGSGFFVTKDGLALTNAHVVGKAEQVKVVLHDGQKLTAEVVERAPNDIDLALIQVPVDSAAPLDLAGFDDLRVGSWVGSVGHGAGGVWTFTKGMVSNIYPAEKSRPIFQTQIPLNPGASGGPVFDRKGRVVGVVTAGIVDTNAVNFAIRAHVALTSLEKLADNCRCLTVEAPEGIPIFLNGKMIGKGPRVLVSISEGEHEVFSIIKGKKKTKTIEYPETTRVTLE